MAAMFLVAPLITLVDNRLIIGFGFLLTALSMWQLSSFSLQKGIAPVVVSGRLQGFGLGCTQVPLNILALSITTGPHPDPGHRDPQPDAQSRRQHRHQRSGCKPGQKTQIVHSHLVDGVRPDNPLVRAPFLAALFSLSTPGGMAALNAEVTRQAATVAYIDDFRLMMLIALATMPVLLLREGRRRALTTGAGD
jgi:DHA2 family multidrug resistance protein